MGLKIAFTNRTIWPRYGVFQPIFGFAYNRWIVPGSVDTALGELRLFKRYRTGATDARAA